MSMEPRNAVRRRDYPHTLSVPTRWMDNDMYGHVNNVVYYSYFDTAINEYLIRFAGFEPWRAAAIGVCVESACQFHRPLSFPEVVDVGLRVAHLGSTSVQYALALFSLNDETAAATGRFVHVFVDRQRLRPVEMPARVRAALAPLLIAEQSD